MLVWNQFADKSRKKILLKHRANTVDVFSSVFFFSFYVVALWLADKKLEEIV